MPVEEQTDAGMLILLKIFSERDLHQLNKIHDLPFAFPSPTPALAEPVQSLLACEGFSRKLDRKFADLRVDRCDFRLESGNSLAKLADRLLLSID